MVLCKRQGINMTQQIMDSTAFLRSIDRIVHEILEHNNGAHNLAIIGVLTRGADIATRISQKIEELENKQIPYGSVDITLYRDDVSRMQSQPVLRSTDIVFSIDLEKWGNHQYEVINISINN